MDGCTGKSCGITKEEMAEVFLLNIEEHFNNEQMQRWSRKNTSVNLEKQIKKQILDGAETNKAYTLYGAGATGRTDHEEVCRKIPWGTLTMSLKHFSLSYPLEHFRENIRVVA